MIKDKLDDFLEKALVNYDLPGLAVGIEIGNKSPNANRGLLYQSAVGYKNIETGQPLIKENVFHMASVTKLFVGSAILKLYENGLISLDGLLTDYLPWFKMADERYKKIKIRHLLSHTSGIPNVDDYHWDNPEMDDEALERFIRSSEVSQATLLWDPEQGRFSYSDMAYEILGVVISKVSGRTFEDYIKETFLVPLNMNNSKLLTYEWGIYDKENPKADIVCSPHEKNEKKEIVPSKYFPYNRAHGPSSTLTSNVEDIRKWGRAHLEKRVLLEKTYDLAWGKQALVPNNGENICLSWFRREQNGYVLFGHEGTDDGFRASFWICPELDLSIVVCSNISAAPVKKISKQLFDIITK